MNNFTTGSTDLDNLLEELRTGDNVVFYTDTAEAYVPFVATLATFLATAPDTVIYVRTSGLLDGILADLPRARIVDAAVLAVDGDVILALEQEARRIGPFVYYVFDPLDSWARWLPGQNELGRFFTTVCPLLYQLQSIAYWALIRGRHQPQTVAQVRDCTQVFLRLERRTGADGGDEQLLTPLKVVGRYSEDMFRPHRVMLEGGRLVIHPLPIDAAERGEYVEALANKNRELAEVRDALDRSNRALQSRNEELAVLNRQLLEQNRLYRSLRANLDHLMALFRARREIGSSLMMEQVRQAIVRAAREVFAVPAAQLRLVEGGAPLVLTDGEGALCDELVSTPACASLRGEVMTSGAVRSLVTTAGSLAVASVVVRGRSWGTLEIAAQDDHLDSEEVRTMLGFLVSEASIALENALLHRETEVQGEQLRSFIDDVIVSEERDNRRFAFDLHDGLVQMIVASFQHLQSAQAWRERDPKAEERELAHGIAVLQQSIHEARRLISKLRPPGLDDLGLLHALRIYVAQLADETGWQVGLEIAPDWPSLPHELETALYRIVQEATTNARKYAHADRISMRLSATADDLCVSVRDWGQGFDPDTTLAAPGCDTGIGLVGIRERARHWGGRCDIVSHPGEGTTVSVCIPRMPAQDEAPTHD